MTIGVGLNRWDWRTPRTFAESVRRGEAAGLSHAFVPVNPLALLDPYVLMATAAQATSRIRFGPMLETPVLRPPAVAAGSIAALAEVSDGRAMLTYGVGDTAVRWLGRRPATIAELGQAVTEARALLAGDGLDVGAERPARLLGPVREAAANHRPVPVWVAAGGPRSLRMAGRVADGVFLRVGTHPANLTAAVDAVRDGAADADREPSDVAIGLVVHTCRSQDPAEIRAISRAMAAGFYEYTPTLFDQPGFEWTGPPVEELQAELWPDFHHAADLVAAGSMVEFLDDEIADAFSFYGTDADVADQVAQVVAAVPEAAVIVPHPVPMPTAEDIGPYIDRLGTLADQLEGR